jgi:hypothetical protein
MTDAHIASLDAQLKMLGGREASDVKSAWETAIGRAIPRIVLQELAVDGERVDMSVASTAVQIVERTWQPARS